MTISGSNNLIFVLIVTGGMGMSSASDAQGYNPVTQQAQSRLASLGDDPGTLDGVLGSATVNAIRAFQTRSTGDRNPGRRDPGKVRDRHIGGQGQCS